ncbi:hypothetical protein NS44R_15135, partial [Mammaliicoccus sciuri]
VAPRKIEIPVEASRIGHRIAVDDLLDGVAEQQLLDRKLLLLAGQRARNLRHHEDVVGQEAARQSGFDCLVDPGLHRGIEDNALAQHHEQRHVAVAAEIFEVDHHRIQHLGQRLDRRIEFAGAHPQAMAVDGGVAAAIDHAGAVGFDLEPVAMPPHRAAA